MTMEQEMKTDGAQIDFEMDNMPFMDGQYLNETCVMREAPQNSYFNEENDRLQYSPELH